MSQKFQQRSLTPRQVGDAHFPDEIEYACGHLAGW
jgi:hypothetical protein